MATRLAGNEIPTACADDESGPSPFDPGDIQEEADPFTGIKEPEDNATPTPIWIHINEAEAATLLGESE
jgi:hypothetical protein